MSEILQGSVLGVLFFLIYLNDIPDGINSLCKIFANVCTGQGRNQRDLITRAYQEFLVHDQ